MKARDPFEAYQEQCSVWKPASSVRHHGQLTYSPQAGFYLDVAGPAALPDIPWQTLHGFTRDVEPTTFWRTLVNSKLTSLGASAEVTKHRIFVDKIIDGIHLADPDCDFVREAAASLTGLVEWADDRPWPADGVDLVDERLLEIETEPGVRLSVDLGTTSPSSWQAVGRRRTATLWVRADKPMSITRTLETVEWFCTLLTLLSGNAQMVNDFAVGSGSEGRRYRVLRRPLLRSKPSTEHPRLVGARYSELGAGQSVVRKWFVLREELGLPTELLAVCWFGPGTLHPFDFVALAQAAEALDRRLHSDNDHYIDTLDYESVARTLIDAIPHDVPQDLRQSLKQRIKFGNEHSLRTRLRRLREAVPAGILELTPMADKKWVNWVVDLRNDLTHRPTANRKVEPQDVIRASASLAVLIATVVLRAVGVSEHLVLKALQRTSAWATSIDADT